MLVQLLFALFGDLVFGAITERHRGFRAELERCLDEGVAPARATGSSGRPR